MTDYAALVFVIVGPPVIATVIVTIGYVVGSARRRNRPPSRLERQLALARLEDTLARQERTESTEVAS